MANYELMYILTPELDEEGFAAAIQRVSDMVTSRDGTVTDAAPWGAPLGRRRLAYPIQRHRQGSYVLTHFELAQPQVADFERSLKLMQPVIRYLLIREEE